MLGDYWMNVRDFQWKKAFDLLEADIGNDAPKKGREMQCLYCYTETYSILKYLKGLDDKSLPTRLKYLPNMFLKILKLGLLYSRQGRWCDVKLDYFCSN